MILISSIIRSNYRFFLLRNQCFYVYIYIYVDWIIILFRNSS